MTCDELQINEKSCRTLNVIRIITIPILALITIVISVITYVVSKNSKEIKAFEAVLIGTVVTIVAYVIINSIYKKKSKNLYNLVEKSILQAAGVSRWQFVHQSDCTVGVKSSQAVGKYDELKFFKEDETRLSKAIELMKQKQEYKKAFKDFLKNNEYTSLKIYPSFVSKIESNLLYTDSYYVIVIYSSPSGRSQNSKILSISRKRLQELSEDKSILMTKSEYNKYLKEQGKEALVQKQHDYYEKVNNIIDLSNENKDILIIKTDADELDKLIASLFDRTVNSIKKIKTIDSEEWDILDKYISGIEDEINKIIANNKRILDYYASDDFIKIKTTCDTLMSSQKEFNEYIDEKVKSISSLFGTNIVREETAIEDEYNYIHPYKKSLTPFTAEVSAAVFSSAENSPLEYVVKQFYPNKSLYPEQIQKLQLLVEELETLKEAKQIIETHKATIQQYISAVPAFIMENDEDGFYSRLGFAIINEKSLVVAYKFSYTSSGGKAQRSFTVPMTEQTIISLIQALEDKLTYSAFAKEQRAMMTSKLRQQIKERDNYTCQICGNSTMKEPNLLLEIDHKIPVAKGGLTEETNLQTLCWRCNRSKSDKLVSN